MRIWHQSFATLSRLPAYDAALRTHIRKVVRPDTEVVMHGMHKGTYRHDYPGTDLRHGWVQMMKETLRSIVPRFSARRMLKEYASRMYVPAAREGDRTKV